MTGFLLAMPIFGAWAQQAAALSLDDALKIAKENSYSLKLAESNVEKARLRVAEASGALGPRVSASGTYSLSDASAFGNKESKSASLGVAWPVDLVGATRKAMLAAKMNRMAAEANRDAVWNGLRANVKTAYAQALKAQATLTVVKEGLARSQERLANVQKEFAAGARAKVDVMRLETTVTQSEADVVSATSGLELAKSALNVAISRPMQTPVELSEMTWWAPESKDEGTWIKQAEGNRPELTALFWQERTLGFVREATEVGMLPSFSVSLQHTRQFGPLGSFSLDKQTTGVAQVTIPLYDSGITRSRVKQARQDIEQVQIQREQTLLSISLEVRQARLNYETAMERLKLAEKQKELATENYRLTSLRFDNGEGIALEVADASTQLTAANVAVVNARYDALTALAQLEKAVGTELKEQK